MKTIYLLMNPSSSSQFNSSTIQYYLMPFILFCFIVVPNKIPAVELVAFFYGILPIIDICSSLDLKNPSKQEVKLLEENNIYFQICLYVSMVVNWICFFKVLNIISSDTIQTLSYIEILAHLILYGSVAAMGIIVSHEIYHKQGIFKKTIGLVNMINTLYIHWTVEHIIGHHRNVATPKDPATAIKNTSFYQFLPKSLKGGWISCYNIQKERGKNILTNLAVVSIISNILVCVAVYKWYCLKGFLFFVAGGVLSCIMLELINYIEHYGLERKHLLSGEYQRVNIKHSWNTPHRFTNYFMFKLQRHSDHHQNSYKPYQTLLTLDESPHLPQGYTAMMTIALYPNTFFQIMHPLLEYYKQKHEGKNPDESLIAISSEKSKKFSKGMALKLVGLAALNYIITRSSTFDSMMSLG